MPNKCKFKKNLSLSFKWKSAIKIYNWKKILLEPHAWWHPKPIQEEEVHKQNYKGNIRKKKKLTIGKIIKPYKTKAPYYNQQVWLKWTHLRK